MSKRSVIHCILSVLLIGYLVFALCYTSHKAKAEPYKALDIKIEQSQTSDFLTPEIIDGAIGHLRDSISRMPAWRVNTRGIELSVLGLDNVEQANCAALGNRRVLLEVTPLIPVARVYDTGSDTPTYYINRAGKRMRPDARFRVDVSVVVGNFANRSAADVMPVIDYVNSDASLRSLISAYEVKPNGDIMLVPMMRGHVVNFGDTADIANKFARLRVFYRKVMPVKGWEYYDTLSVKWRGQVVAKRHGKDQKASAAPVEDFSDIVDINTMLTDMEE
ncbi:MAG: hypothetical protein NC102_03365 [Clostridium sp.]|nr:hypothetical protein [Clostridium sp.]